MIPTELLSTESDVLEIELLWHQWKELEAPHPLIAHIGGLGSGKSFTNWLLLNQWSDSDTSQRYGLFANTAKQLQEGILPELFELTDAAGIDHVYGRKPPDEWVRRWKRNGIAYPQRGPRSPNTWIWETGLHVVCAGLENYSYKRLKSFQFRAVIHEEFTEQRSADAFNFLFPRVRCGQWGSGKCRAQHRHQYFARGNAPDPRRPHWLREWIKGMRNAETERRVEGKPPFFLYLKSSTRDNIAHVGPEYIDRLQAGLDAATARAAIDGDLEQFITNRTYWAFGAGNIHPLVYDPERPLYVALDFNWTPSICTFGHDLRDDELPDEFRGRGLQHVHGVHGVLYREGGLDATQLARAILHGSSDMGSYWPLNFRGLLNHRERIYLYGDPAGKQRRMEAQQGGSAWTQLMDEMSAPLGKRLITDIASAAPTQFESVALMNAWAQNAAGERRYFVAPICKPLIRDYEHVVPKEDGSELIDKDADKTLTHLSDAERYKMAQRFMHIYRSMKKRNQERSMMDGLAASHDFPASPLRSISRSPFR